LNSLQAAGQRPTLAGTIGGERQETCVINSNDGKQAASSPDWLSGPDRGCVKTRLQRKYRGPSTLGAVAIVDPEAIWRVVLARDRFSIEFSHSLD